MSKPTATKALNAALVLFAAQGVARTSMADIAEAAAISRATLYTHFRDKDALLQALAASVVDDWLTAMRDAWRPGTAFGTNLEAAILAKDLALHRLKHTSPHGGALLAASPAIDRCARTLEDGFIAFVRERAGAEPRGTRRFVLFGGIPAFAIFVAQSAAGFKDAIADEAAYRTALHTFAALIETATSTGIAATPKASQPRTASGASKRRS